MSMGSGTSNFIWDAIDEDLKAGRYERVHPFPAGAQWISAHRPLQGPE